MTEIDPRALVECAWLLMGCGDCLDFLHRGIWSQQAYAMGIQAAKAAKAGDHLFAEEGLIPKFYDELSIHSFYTGHYESCILYGAKAYFKADPAQQPRILANIKFGVDKNT